MTTTTKPHELTAHPLADIFPLMEGGKFDALVADIKANGLREPITLYEDKILDGRNRYNAVIKAGLQYKLKDENFRPFTGNDPLGFVVSANLHRRHLTESERGMVAAKIVDTKLGANQYNKSSVTTEQAAKLLAVSETTVKRAKKVYEKATPEIVEAVRKGNLRVGMAAKVAGKPKEQQAQALAEAMAKAKEAKATAKTAREASKSNKPTKPTKEQNEHNQRMADLDAFKKKWAGFNDMQQRAFFEAYRDGLQTILKKIEENEAYRHAAE
jgi:ParB-like chromosome segregation protein Spo0J